MGLKGSKSMFIFFSLPSSVITVPVYTTRPLGGTCGAGGAAQRMQQGAAQRSRAGGRQGTACCGPAKQLLAEPGARQ